MYNPHDPHTPQDGVFELMKFNIIEKPLNSFPPQYVYAWHHGIYPFSDHQFTYHTPFGSNFKVSMDMIHDLFAYLDDRWCSNHDTSFMDLRKQYQTHTSDSKWCKGKLHHACHYLFLSGYFDSIFWDKISHYEKVNKPFSLEDDIY